MKKIFTENQIPEIAELILKRLLTLPLSIHHKAQIIALYGDLGAGKTTLTKEIARQLGIKENVNSPTFVLIKNYELRIKNYRYKKLIHIDAYRFDSEKELEHLGWEKMLADPTNLIFIEWPERVKKFIPKDAIKIYLKHKGEKRSLEIDFDGR